MIAWPDFIENFEWRRDVTPMASLPVMLACVAAYLSIFSVSRGMVKYLGPQSDAGRASLKRATFVHNVVLTVLSAVMSVGMATATAQEVLRLQEEENVSTGGAVWEVFYCQRAGQENSIRRGPMAFWMYVFYLSKYYEFVDTVLLVAARKEVTYLHWWHHGSVVTLMWLCIDSAWSSVNRQITIANSFVHVVMYSYYALASAGWQAPWRQWITRLQLMQFFYALSLQYLARYYFSQMSDEEVTEAVSAGSVSPWWEKLGYRHHCGGDPITFVWMNVVNYTYLALFINFYVQQYLSKPRSSRKAKKDD